MNESDYRAEMAKQARIANLIELRRLCVESESVANWVDTDVLSREITRELWA